MSDQAISTSDLVSERDVEDFIAGTNLLSGAGGTPREAIVQLKQTLAEGHAVGWTDFDELADDDLVVAAWFSGSVDPGVWSDRAGREAQAGVTPVHERPLLRAVEHLERQLGAPAAAIIAIEIGGSNTAAALDAAMRLGRVAPDADYAGRAIPSIDCTLPAIAGLADAPLALADYYGNVVEVPEAANVGRMEAIAKMVASATLGRVGSAGIALPASVARDAVAHGTLTASLSAGRALRAARAAGGDIAGTVAAEIPGCLILFRGTLQGSEWDNATGYMIGHHEVQGTDEFEGHRLRVFFQNENHVAWLDDEPVAMSPDLIEMLDEETGEPLVNTFLVPGQHVVVLGIRRRAELDTSAVIDGLGPGRWGFDFPFVGIEHHAARSPHKMTPW